jgi:hypothetical protein
MVPIDAAQARRLNAIDGKRTIRQLVQVATSGGPSHERQARAFFEQLWQYDEVVFDASRAYLASRGTAEADFSRSGAKAT